MVMSYRARRVNVNLTLDEPGGPEGTNAVHLSAVRAPLLVHISPEI